MKDTARLDRNDRSLGHCGGVPVPKVSKSDNAISLGSHWFSAADKLPKCYGQTEGSDPLRKQVRERIFLGPPQWCVPTSYLL